MELIFIVMGIAMLFSMYFIVWAMNVFDTE